MIFKSILRRITAFGMAMGCMFLDVTAYANDKVFNPMYSGRLSFSSSMYMEISDSNAILHCVWYPVSLAQSKLISVENPETLKFDTSKLIITYNHKGTIMSTDGTTYGETPENIMIISDKTQFAFGLFNRVISAEVDYNGIKYKS